MDGMAEAWLRRLPVDDQLGPVAGRQRHRWAGRRRPAPLRGAGRLRRTRPRGGGRAGRGDTGGRGVLDDHHRTERGLRRLLPGLPLPGRPAAAAGLGPPPPLAAGRRCRRARWRWPAGSPPSTRRPRRGVGCCSAGPRVPSSTPTVRPTPLWLPGDTVRFTARPATAGPGPIPEAEAGAPTPDGRRRSLRRGGRPPACSAWSRTADGAEPRASAFPRPVRPTPTPCAWPTGWSATPTGPPPSRSPPPAPGSGSAAMATWPWWPRRPTGWRSGWTTGRCPTPP